MKNRKFGFGPIGLAVLAAAMGLASAAAAAEDSARSGDAMRGQVQFVRKCATCHPVDPGGRSNLGPNLHGVIGRVVGSYAGFRYGPPYLAAAARGEVWTPERVFDYLVDPTGMYAGGRMVFRIKDSGIRADLAAYLASFSSADRPGAPR